MTDEPPKKPREKKPITWVEFEAHPPVAHPSGVGLTAQMLVIRPRSRRPYKVLLKEDAKWQLEAITEMLDTLFPPGSQPQSSPRRRKRKQLSP